MVKCLSPEFGTKFHKVQSTLISGDTRIALKQARQMKGSLLATNQLDLSSHFDL